MKVRSLRINGCLIRDFETKRRMNEILSAMSISSDGYIALRLRDLRDEKGKLPKLVDVYCVFTEQGEMRSIALTRV